MDKEHLLSYLKVSQGATAHRVARDLVVSYPVAAMALLRLARQGLVERFLDPARGIYWYRLTERGAERLAYLRSEN
jgi:DNA-binding MarR family transcriptional regulator